MTTCKEQLSQIQSLTETVTSEHASYEAARTTERDAETEVLTVALKTLQPALRALSSRILKMDRTWVPQGSNSPEPCRESHEVQGVCLVGANEPYTKKAPNDDFRGVYTGRGLFVLTDGTLACLSWSGTWSSWQGAESEAMSKLTRYASVRDALDDGWRLTAILDGICRALEAQATGNKAQATRAAMARGEKLRALLALVK